MKGRKVFISFLGTNEYEPVYYLLEGKKATSVPAVFVQEALIRSVCKGWGPKDAVMIFRTEKSESLNWLDRPCRHDPATLRPGLSSTLKALHYPMQTNPQRKGDTDKDSYIIPPGFDEEELWAIFKAVSDKIEPDDEIYFDVTHAFRTIPLFATVLFNYCRFMKGSMVKGVYYGAFEKLGSLQEVRKIPEEQRMVPIVDMRSLVTLQSINIAASNFANYGTVGTIGMQIDATGDVLIDNAISGIRDALSNLDFYMQTCRIDDILAGEYMAELKENLDTLRDRGLNSAQLRLLMSILERLTDCGFREGDSYENAEAAICWLIEYGMIQQALTLIREYVPIRIADHLDDNDNGDAGFSYSDWHTIADNALKMGPSDLRKKMDERKARYAVNLQRSHGWNELSRAFKTLRDMRNDLNHANDKEYGSLDIIRGKVADVWDVVNGRLSDFLLC